MMEAVMIQLFIAAIIVQQGRTDFAVHATQETAPNVNDLLNELRTLREEYTHTQSQTQTQINALKTQLEALQNQANIQQFVHKTLNDRIQDFRDGITDVNTDINHVQDDINHVQDDIKVNNERMQTEINNMQGQLRELRNYTGNQLMHQLLNHRIEDLRAYVTDNIDDAAEADYQRMVHLNETMDQIEKKRNDYEKALMDRMERHDRLLNTSIERQSSDIESLRTNKADIQERFAFQAILTEYNAFSRGDTVIFNNVLLNIGNGYNVTSGIFTVPSGGGGLYYFSTYENVQTGEFAKIQIQVNGVQVCAGHGDNNNNGANDTPRTGCSAVVNVIEGDEVKVIYGTGTDSTPFGLNNQYYYNGFNGFRISP